MIAPQSCRSWIPAAILAIGSVLASGQPPHARAQDARPELTIVEPDPASPLVGTVRMRADLVPADGVVLVDFQVNGAPACTALPPPPFTCAWEAGDGPEAAVVRAVARLADGGRVVRSIRARGRPPTLFSAGTSMVLVPVVVQDRRGRFVTGLSLDDFALFEDGVLQAPTLLDGASALPLDLVLVVDFSSSMARSLGSLQLAARHFIGEMPEGARLGLVAFNDRVYPLASREQNRTVVLRALDTLPMPFGGTALLDALGHALDLHGTGQAHRVVVLFSDGDDQNSIASPDTVEQRIRAGQTTVYAVTMRRGSGSARAEELLRGLTQVSGGRWFPIERIEDLNEVLAHVRTRLDSSYVLAYEPSNRARNGRWRRIDVRTSDHRHVITAREGYAAAEP